jgi:2-oxoglutarate ferredoxin oxidoreductase subunit alpha
LSESYKTTKFAKVKKIKLNFAKGNSRYKMTDSGVSPMTVPGVKGTICKISSYEHNAEGYTVEGAVASAEMQYKRALKKFSIITEMKKMKTVKTYGNGENIVFAWGSSVSQVREAMKQKKIKLVQPLYLEPFPSWEIMKFAKAKEFTLVEQNKDAQLNELLKKDGLRASKIILKYDGRPFEPKDLAKELDEVLK